MKEAAMEAPLDEVFDTQREVERNPCGAWQAIQTLAARLAEVERELAAARELVALLEGEQARADLWQGKANEHEDRAERLEAALRHLEARLPVWQEAVSDWDAGGETALYEMDEAEEIIAAALQQEGGE
jgi:chromosome segregation ATPase